MARHHAGRERPAEIPLALSEAEGSEVEGSGARDLLLNSGTKLGPYEIVSAISAAGMGEVNRARDTRVDRSGTIKMLGLTS